MLERYSTAMKCYGGRAINGFSNARDLVRADTTFLGEIVQTATPLLSSKLGLQLNCVVCTTLGLPLVSVRQGFTIPTCERSRLVACLKSGVVASLRFVPSAAHEQAVCALLHHATALRVRCSVICYVKRTPAALAKCFNRPTCTTFRRVMYTSQSVLLTCGTVMFGTETLNKRKSSIKI